jgi:hypothetical protein
LVLPVPDRSRTVCPLRTKDLTFGLVPSIQGPQTGRTAERTKDRSLDRSWTGLVQPYQHHTSDFPCALTLPQPYSRCLTYDTPEFIHSRRHSDSFCVQYTRPATLLPCTIFGNCTHHAGTLAPLRRLHRPLSVSALNASPSASLVHTQINIIVLLELLPH